MGYQTLQALYAIGSGGLLGRGLGNSIQKLGSVPEAQNDMIFSIVCEELGIAGGVKMCIRDRNSEETGGSSEGKTAEELKLEDGDYTVEVALEGGSGKATVESPAEMKISDGKVMATITWSSPNYDYMIVDGEKYEMVNTEGNSVFDIPVAAFDTALEVKADTVAMSRCV